MITLPRKVYHGTITKHFLSFTQGIDLNKCEIKNDFGQGFYLALNYDQALKYGVYKTNEFNNSELKIANEIANYTPQYVKPLIIQYDLDSKRLLEFNGEIFNSPNDKWGEFVYNNREGINSIISEYHNCDKRFDFVYGDIADTKLFLSLKKFKTGIINLKEFTRSIQPYKHSDYKYLQLSLHTDRAINCLNNARIGGI